MIEACVRIRLYTQIANSAESAGIYLFVASGKKPQYRSRLKYAPGRFWVFLHDASNRCTKAPTRLGSLCEPLNKSLIFGGLLALTRYLCRESQTSPVQ